jgi:hypothetical protein
MITVALLAGIFLCGSILMGAELMDAPTGYQDETGFHPLGAENSVGWKR